MSYTKTKTAPGTRFIPGITGTGLLVLLLALAYTGPLGAVEAVKRKPLDAAGIERARNYFTDTEMLTQAGDKVRFYSDMLDDRVVVINVMYTSCSGACPLITQKLSAVSRELGGLFGEQVHFISVSNDAERDTPEALTEFARKQGVNLDGWTFLTGDKNKVDGVLRKIGLYVPHHEQHLSMILLGNTRTGHWQKLRPDLPHEAVVARIRELAAEG